MDHVISTIRESGLFDENWYMSQHPDVGALGLDPIYHYVEIGAFLGRDPGPEFSTSSYLNKYEDVEQSGINPLYHFLKWGRSEGRTAEKPMLARDGFDFSVALKPSAGDVTALQNLTQRDSIIEEQLTPPKLVVETAKKATAKAKISQFSVEDLDIKLWGGFSRYAIPELENWKNSSKAKSADRAQAAWFLSRWFYVAGDFQTALENISVARLLNAGLEKEIALLETQCLIKLQRYALAKKCLTLAIEKLGARPDFLLLQSTIKRFMLIRDGKKQSIVDRLQLAAINEIYTGAGLAPLELKDNSQPLHFSNITATAPSLPGELPNKVTIIIPAFNAESTIRVSVDSLLAQTWHNIEIIVVDDCSTDNTRDVVAEIAKADPRVKLICQELNQGAYPSRNRGLREVTGDYIMVHDSDDWSHPQKIELQMKTLAESPSCVAVMSHWVRVEEYFEAVGSWLPKGTLFDLNFSSLMFKREVMDRLGGWDEARVSGDAEFRTRMMNIYGSKSICKTKHSQLLSLSLSREDSLTRSKSTHLRSLLFGMRWQYRDAYQYWHQKNNFVETSTVVPGEERRHFPLPLGNRPKKSETNEYDVIVICDFVLRGGAFVSTFNYIKAACDAGKRVAVVHWRKYELNPHSSLNPKLYDICVERGVDILTPGDVASSDVVIVGYPAILQNLPDSFPTIRAKHVIVVVNQFASRLYDGSDQQYDPLIARANLTALLGDEGIWVPISYLVKTLMRKDSRYPVPHSKPWVPMIDTSVWCSSPLRWRGASGGVPVIGRHGRDAYTKWPTDIQALRDAYGIDRPAIYRFLGGANHALKVLKDVPPNWEILPFDQIDVRTFLADLDFYIHYPHENYIEEFGRAVMEAMAVGIPVILPLSFKKTFQDAAVYVETNGVWSEIERMWKSKDAYLLQAKKGRDFVLNNCSISQLDERIAHVVKEKYTKKSKNRVVSAAKS